MKRLHAALFACVFAISLSACAAQESIAVSPDHKNFVLIPSGQEFKPWGFNYDRDYKMRLLEDYWATEWSTVEGDFREMKGLGANVVRVHLQLNKFLDAPDRPNEANLKRLAQLLTLAEKLDLHLDLTGCASYHKRNDPDWYAKADEHDRWQAQANFWSAIAKTCANSPSVFCYDLINEPVVPTNKQTDWLVNVPLAGFYYVNYLCLDPNGRDRMEIARQWTKQMIAAIRQNDRTHLITVGILPNTPDLAKALAPQLDFIATHFYPQPHRVDQGLADLKRFSLGKPLVVEETFPLPASVDEMADFITRARPIANGFISFYWGKSIGELKNSRDPGDAILLAWLTRFQTLKP